MKKIFGTMSVAALVAMAPVASANPAQVAVAERVLLEQSARAVRAAEVIFNGSIANSRDLVGKQVAGVAVTATEAQALFAMAAPLVSALTSNKSVKPTAGDFDRWSRLVSAKETGLVPNAAIASIAEVVSSANGVLDDSAIAAAFETKRAENSAHLLPSTVSAMQDSELLFTYVATTDAGMAALSTPAETLEAEANRAAALKIALTEAPGACSTQNAAQCMAEGLEVYENWVATGYDKRGEAALGFFSQVVAGFPGEQDAAAPEQYRQGGVNSLQMIREVGDLAQAPAAVQALNNCWTTGNSAAGQYAVSP